LGTHWRTKYSVICGRERKGIVYRRGGNNRGSQKLPLSLIASGKNEVVEESHFRDVGHHRTDHSESGWTTCDTFRRWLVWLRGVYDVGQRIWLFDCYTVHRQAAMKQYAAKLGINLLFIPPGLTVELQPLDRFVFRAMKANCRRMYQVQVAEEGVMSK
jgi:hypothetical protein